MNNKINYKIKYLEYKKRYHMSKENIMIGGAEICLCGRRNNLTKIYEHGKDKPIYVCCFICYKTRKENITPYGDPLTESHDSGCHAANSPNPNIPHYKCSTCDKYSYENKQYCCNSCRDQKKIMDKIIIHDNDCFNKQYCSFCGMMDGNYVGDKKQIISKKYGIICCSDCCETDGRTHNSKCFFYKTYRPYINKLNDEIGHKIVRMQNPKYSNPSSDSFSLSKTEGKKEEKKIEHRSIFIPPGIQNLGDNSCFINSSLQLIYRMTFLMDYITNNYSDIQQKFNQLTDRINVFF